MALSNSFVRQLAATLASTCATTTTKPNTLSHVSLGVIAKLFDCGETISSVEHWLPWQVGY